MSFNKIATNKNTKSSEIYFLEFGFIQSTSSLYYITIVRRMCESIFCYPTITLAVAIRLTDSLCFVDVSLLPSIPLSPNTRLYSIPLKL